MEILTNECLYNGSSGLILPKQMKKAAASILAFLYLTVSSGIALEIHYCMGKQAGIELYGSGNDRCGRCGMTDTKSGCCHDEYRFYKLEDSHKLASNDIVIGAGEAIPVNDHFSYNSSLPGNSVAANFKGHSPPQPSGPSACVLNCVFRL